MIPSRGLQWSTQAVGNGRRRIGVLSTRQFSSSTVQHRQFRASPLLSNITSSSFKPTSRLTTLNTISVFKNGAGLRFASTTPSTSPAETVPLVPDATASPSDLTTSLDSFSSIDPQTITNLPEQIGYLKALGLDYGIGPTSVAQWLLEHTHVYCGTPWWISIGLTAILVRALLFKPYLWAADTGSKMRAIKPLTDPIREKMKAASSANNMQAVMDSRNELSRIHRAAGVNMWKGFMAPLGQGFLGFGTFFLLRAMAKLPVPGLETGGVLWFTNLTLPDPYFLLPLATATVGHWLFRFGGETGQSTMSPQMQKFFMYGFPVLTLIFTWWLPAAVQLSFFASSALGFIQAAMLRNETIRNFFKLAPKPVDQTAPISPYKGKMKIAASTSNRNPASRPGALSTTELNSRFQQPSNLSSANESSASETPSILGKLKGSFTEVEGFRKDMIAKGKASLETRMEKSNKKEAELYEKKRQDELRQQRQQDSQRRRAERAARRAGKNDDGY